MSGARVLVVGFGNDLMGDDGCGLAVVGRLRDEGRVPGLRAEEGWSDSLRLPLLWRAEEEVWLVDAVVRGAAPGTVHRLSHEELLAVPQRHGTVHQLSLPESLRWIALAHPAMAGVRYRLWGIEPVRLSVGEGLSPEVRRAVSVVVEEIYAAALGAP